MIRVHSYVDGVCKSCGAVKNNDHFGPSWCSGRPTARAEANTLREQVERLTRERDKAVQSLGGIEAHIREHLTYTYDDGEVPADEASPKERVEYAAREIRDLKRERDEARAEIARLRGQAPLLDNDPRPLTPEAFIASCQRCRPTKHLHGWGARELGAMVAGLVEERDRLLKAVRLCERSAGGACPDCGWPDRHSRGCVIGEALR